MNGTTSAAATVASAANKATNFANQTVENGRFEAAKEPVGFIKIVQFFMAILAFAIAVNGSSSLSFNAACTDVPLNAQRIPTVRIEAKYSYPYDLKNVNFAQTSTCILGKAPVLDRRTLTEEGFNIKSSAEFFVFLGVVSFLYSFGMLIVYIFLKQKYDNIFWLPLLDFGVTVLFSICWFISDIAWAKAISDIQTHTNTNNVIGSLPTTCPKNGASATTKCISVSYATYGTIIISCIIGFCNLILWSGNIWFVLKETTWYKTRKSLQQQQQNMTSNPISVPSNTNLPNQFSNINDKI